jgi:hypothetical protein
MALIAQLRDDVVFLSRFHQLAHFVDGMGQGFLAIDVFAAFDGGHGRHGVGVVGRGDHHGVYLFFHLVEHFAEVFVALGIRVFLEGIGSLFFVHIAQGDDLDGAGAVDFVKVAGALTAHANTREANSIVRGYQAGTAKHVARNDREKRCGAQQVGKLTAGNL